MIRPALGLVLVLLWSSPGLAMESGRLVQVRTVRSIAAEAAAVCDQLARGQATTAYAEEMLREASSELRSARKSALRRGPDLEPLIAQALAAIGTCNGATLHGVSDRLFAMEGPHGRAD